MRKEIIHFLEQTTDEKIMLTFIKNMDLHSLMTLFHYLSFTDPNTTERWLDVYCCIAQ
ncbi:hypothetical protein GN156_09710 [bacterium LRH843]|nr:hypothetical protein [bacterium LRH843]